jgi:hypothetical protein
MSGFLMLRNNYLVLFLLLGVFARPTFAHKFPDGYIDRTISVLIRDRHVEIEYSIGMNDRTMEQVVEAWKEDRSNGKDDPSTSDRISLDTSNLNVSAGKPQAMPRLADVKQPVDGEVPEFVENDPQVLETFEKLAAEKLVADFQVANDGQALGTPGRWTTLPTKRHMSLTLTMNFELPEKKASKLVIRDNNFRDLAGGVRKSIKAKGSSILTKSNAAPIIVRAQRIERADVDVSSWQDANTLEAQIVQVRIKSK